MNTYRVVTKVELDGTVTTFSQVYKGKTYSSVAVRALKYIEKTCPSDFADASQIAMRIKRRIS